MWKSASASGSPCSKVPVASMQACSPGSHRGQPCAALPCDWRRCAALRFPPPRCWCRGRQPACATGRYRRWYRDHRQAWVRSQKARTHQKQSRDVDARHAARAPQAAIRSTRQAGTRIPANAPAARARQAREPGPLSSALPWASAPRQTGGVAAGSVCTAAGGVTSLTETSPAGLGGRRNFRRRCSGAWERSSSHLPAHARDRRHRPALDLPGAVAGGRLWRSSWSGSCGIASSRACGATRRHEYQSWRSAGLRRSARRATGPLRHLATHLTNRRGAIDGRYFCAIRQAQHRTRTQLVDVAAEGIWIRTVDGDHRLLHHRLAVVALRNG